MNDYTDGMFGTPRITDNCISSIERAIAFDSRDWLDDRRSAWIYSIVFGFDDEYAEACKREMMDHFGWSAEDFTILDMYHKQWLAIKQKLLE